MALRVVFIGGTGIVRSACAVLAVERGIDPTVLNRGGTSAKPSSTSSPSPPDHVAAEVGTFHDRTGQFVLVSSASAYQKPVAPRAAGGRR